MRRAALLAALLACLAFPAPAQDITVNGAGFEGRAKLSPEAAAHPEFAQFLEGLARDELENRRDEQEEEGGARVRLEIAQQTRFASARFVSVLSRQHEQASGAPALVLFFPYTWDAEARDLLRLDGFLLDAGPGGGALQEIAAALYQRIRSDIWRGALKDGDERLRQISYAIEPDPGVLSNFTLAPSTEPGLIGGFTFHYAAGEVAPGARGPQSVAIPWTVVKAFLRPAMKPYFGGSPRGF